MLQHLGDFPGRLAEHGHAVYEYTPCPPVGYPELADELWCHRYYLRNLCDEERFPDWRIVDHVPFLQASALCPKDVLILHEYALYPTHVPFGGMRLCHKPSRPP